MNFYTVLQNDAQMEVSQCTHYSNYGPELFILYSAPQCAKFRNDWPEKLFANAKSLL